MCGFWQNNFYARVNLCMTDEFNERIEYPYATNTVGT